MKKLVILSNESVFSGAIKCGIAEVTDSLANSLSLDYNVHVICPDCNGAIAKSVSSFTQIMDGVRSCKFSNVIYYLIAERKWDALAPNVVDLIQPDILHNLAEPEIINKLTTRPKKTIYSFDDTKMLIGKENLLLDYDSVVAHSKNFAKEILETGDTLSEVLSKADFHGITDGILDTVLAPEKGMLLPAKFSPEDMSGKALCKERIKQIYGIKGDPFVCLIMCRLVKEKNIEAVIRSIPTIKAAGGVLIVIGTGDAQYEQSLKSYRVSDGVIFVNRRAFPTQAAPMTAGADFYLQPSIVEPCGLMPMTASHYGAIPIVTLNGGLADNFNDDNAIIVRDNELDDAIYKAAALYNDKEKLETKRKLCMEQDFSWRTRKLPYIELYEKE